MSSNFITSLVLRLQTTAECTESGNSIISKYSKLRMMLIIMGMYGWLY